ncbi:unnamed protein product [Ranitomeya imitator]|uniref:Uncharacterized protein n=1 Tax=Ranitomeya imitator TaxID=111125 RepID=A0ABN9M2X7_9NEOB|nr:unnamed protein product [Ranitomeya imitator]
MAILEAYRVKNRVPPPGIKVHSTRAVGASWAVHHRASALQLCKAATWSSIHTFAKFYKIRNYASADASLGRRILQVAVWQQHTPMVPVSPNGGSKKQILRESAAQSSKHTDGTIAEQDASIDEILGLQGGEIHMSEEAIHDILTQTELDPDFQELYDLFACVSSKAPKVSPRDSSASNNDPKAVSEKGKKNKMLWKDCWTWIAVSLFLHSLGTTNHIGVEML